jgi:predicted NAD/FAD-dependent oxidoreductase
MKNAMIIGAGMAGLTAACYLRESGWSVELIEKGRGVGGRVATRRVTNAAGASGRIDHGAQFFTAREEPMLSWAQAFGVEWWRDGEHVRFRGAEGMNDLAKAFAEGLTIHRQQRVVRLERDAGWIAHTESGEKFSADAVILTAPVPQSLEILRRSEIAYDTALDGLNYDPCLAVLAILKKSTDLPMPGTQRFLDGPVAWMADNQMKGISEIPTATLHATPEFSAAHFRGDREAAGQAMIDAAGIDVESFVVHGWLYSQPKETHSDFAPLVCENPPLYLAGDAYYAPRVEGAVMSGLGAAERLCRSAT